MNQCPPSMIHDCCPVASLAGANPGPLKKLNQAWAIATTIRKAISKRRPPTGPCSLQSKNFARPTLYFFSQRFKIPNPPSAVCVFAVCNRNLNLPLQTVNRQLPLHFPSFFLFSISKTYKMAEEVYDGAIGIDLGMFSSFIAQAPHREQGVVAVVASLQNFKVFGLLTFRSSNEQVPPTLAWPPTRAAMSRSLPTSRVPSPPLRSSPSPRPSD